MTTPAIPIVDLSAAAAIACSTSTTNPASTVIDFNALSSSNPDVMKAATALRSACETSGFAYLKGYPIAHELESGVERNARAFFTQPMAEKMKIHLSNVKGARRGYFPMGGEMTSGQPDLKEGIYFARDAVGSKKPLHGPNQYPANPTEMKSMVDGYMAAAQRTGQLVLALLAISLGLPARYFVENGVANDPLVAFPVFHYPPRPENAGANANASASVWGVGEHTDYGLVTLLKQDSAGGLEVKSLDGKTWHSAPPLPETLVMNIGDMLEAMTGGLFRSTPHRVRNPADPKAQRISFPFFFDPCFDRPVTAVPMSTADTAKAAAATAQREAAGYRRWDSSGAAVLLDGKQTYGEYFLKKVSSSFPDVAKDAKKRPGMGSKL